MKKLLICTCVTLLAGCAATSNIVPMGSDRFMMSKQAATGFPGLGNLKAEVFTEANTYCTNLGKKMDVLASSESQGPYILGNYPRAEVQFSCK
jgi:hypothetical protein